ncbi:hypothetical protein Tco_1096323, partial [Tanacetum coccineum]
MRPLRMAYRRVVAFDLLRDALSAIFGLSELKQEKAKKQNGDHDQEEEEIKKHMEIVQDDKVAINVIPLATKPLMIVEYKIDKEGKMGYFKWIRADESSKRYSSMIQMLYGINREDLETLWKLVKGRHGLRRPEEDYERVKYGEIYKDTILLMKKLEIQKKNIKFKVGLLGLKDFKIFLELLLLSTGSIKVTTASYYSKQDLFKWDQHITLVSCGYDWSDQAEEGPNYALMAFLSSSPDSEDQGVIDNGYSRHMTWNMSYLTDYEGIDEGYVAFGGNPKEGKSREKIPLKLNSVLFNDTEHVVLSLNFKLIDESQVLPRVSRKNNMYSLDLKNIVPKGGLTCLFAKATFDESKLWHRRLGKVAQSLFLMKKMYCLVVTDDYSRFTWVFFLATKDETSGILKSFITGIENLVDHKVK